MSKFVRPFLLLSFTWGVMLVQGCSSMLPRADNDSSAFESFEEARDTIEKIRPNESTAKNLNNLGIDPDKHPNTSTLTHSDVVRRFVPSGVVTKDDLDPGIIACIEAREACRGLSITAYKMTRKREGNFFADFFNFTRRTETTGWRFNAVILLLNDLVVYRSWGGQAVVNETEIRTNPLGPLQDIGPSAVSVPPSMVVR